jgi:uncharacterized integral membrane protein
MSRNSAAEMVDSPVPGVIREPTRVHERPPDLARPAAGQPRTLVQTGGGRESRGARRGRKAHRTRLHLYAFVAVAVLAYGVALAASNTHHVKVDWVFGSSSVSLVWVVLFAGILGWLLGILITTLFSWRTRAPRPS